MEEALFARAVDDRLFIRATGHVTAALCPELKAKCFARLENSAPISGIFMDLSQCEYMDSTFLGLIVGLTKKLMAKTGRKLTIVGTSDTCIGLLKTIGVLGLVESLREGPDFPELERIGKGPSASSLDATSDAASAEFILDAHEELAAISDENRDRFSSLNTMLRESIENRKKPR
ncbi:MAG: STAS domain-containing protein [Spirochaetota bacterium]